VDNGRVPFTVFCHIRIEETSVRSPTAFNFNFRRSPKSFDVPSILSTGCRIYEIVAVIDRLSDKTRWSNIILCYPLGIILPMSPIIATIIIIIIIIIIIAFETSTKVDGVINFERSRPAEHTSTSQFSKCICSRSVGFIKYTSNKINSVFF